MKKILEIISCMWVVTFLSSFSGCGGPEYEYDEYFYAINNSSQPVVCYLALGIPEIAPTAYPDTMLPPFCPIPDRKVEYTYYHVLSETPLFVLLGPKESFHNQFGFKDIESLGIGVDTISVFFVNADTLMMKGYNYVRDNYRILIRYDVSMNDFRSDSQIFHFPPSEDMKHIKMYPSYEEFTKVYNPHNS